MQLLQNCEPAIGWSYVVGGGSRRKLSVGIWKPRYGIWQGILYTQRIHPHNLAFLNRLILEQFNFIVRTMFYANTLYNSTYIKRVWIVNATGEWRIIAPIALLFWVCVCCFRYVQYYEASSRGGSECAMSQVADFPGIILSLPKKLDIVLFATYLPREFVLKMGTSQWHLSIPRFYPCGHCTFWYYTP